MVVWMMALIQVCMGYLAGYKTDNCDGLFDKKFSSIDCVATGKEYLSFKIIKENKGETWALFTEEKCEDKPNATVIEIRDGCVGSANVVAIKKQ
ncbi:unnamed protein product [Cunninghamella echinulata]